MVARVPPSITARRAAMKRTLRQMRKSMSRSWYRRMATAVDSGTRIMNGVVTVSTIRCTGRSKRRST